MKNICYFCSVKFVNEIIKTVTICILLLLPQVATAQDVVAESANDSLEISLLTCYPGKEIYSYYGHTAIRVTDAARGSDIVVNYGVFSFKQPFFIPKFIFGLTDYEMGIVSFKDFQAEYQYLHRPVIQQVLNLTGKEKQHIMQALAENYTTAARIYRYNFLYENCTTKAKNILVDNLSGRVEYSNRQERYPSYRDMLHQCNKHHPWASFGNDLLLGVKADWPTNQEEQAFLPFNLMNDFKHAVVVDSTGQRRPLVKQTFKVIDVVADDTTTDPYPTPTTCAWIVALAVVAVCGIEAYGKKRLWLFDTVGMLLIGCAGVLILAMFFSQHPTTSTNLQVLLLNPLPLVFIYRTTKRGIRREKDVYWRCAAIMVAVFLLCGFIQSYAEGMMVFGAACLIRCIWNSWRK